MKDIKSIGVFLLVGFFLLPSVSFAYFTTGQNAVRLNENTLMYLVTYQFGHDRFDYSMPITAVRGGGETNDTENVRYKILKDGKLSTRIGETYSVVLSNAEVQDGSYFVPKGQARKFTLVTFLLLPEERASSTNSFALKVTSLPFEMNADGENIISGKLSSAELNKYITPVISTTASVPK